MMERASAAARKVRFPIGAKLVILVTILLTVSLGAITALVSALVGADVRVTAEDNNFTVNRWTAQGTERALRDLRSGAAQLLGEEASRGPATAAFFFARNEAVAAVAFLPGEEGEGRLLVNDGFAGLSPAGTETLARAWLEEQRALVYRARSGQTVLRNAGPFFGVPLLVMAFPYGGDGAAVFFSPEPLEKNFPQGDHLSFLINETGDVLVHPEAALTAAGANLANLAFVRRALESGERSLQTLYEDEAGEEYLGAFERLTTGNVLVLTTIRSAAVYAGVRAVTGRTLLIGAGTLALAVLIIFLYSQTISRPLKALTRAAGRIEEGDYRLGLGEPGRGGLFQDEIGALRESFISMGYGLDNFEKFTNKAIVRLARQGKLTRTGTATTATICFALLRDFSAITAGMDARDTVSFVNAFLARVVPCVTATGGVVDKFLTQGGVVVMALWGAAESSGSAGEDALNCLRGALMMRSALREWNQERALSSREREAVRGYHGLIKMGCGINLGEVVAGQMGSDERMEFTVIGDAVNLAARFEGPNDLFDTDILVTENVMESIGDELVTEEMPSLEVKGKEKPLRVFAVVNLKGQPGPRTLAEARASWGRV